MSVYTIRLKVLFQEFCLNKLGWDEELKSAKERYEKFVSEIKDLNGIRMPRCLFDIGKKVTKVEIHAFSDASASAYGGVVYLRAIYETGEVSIRFIASKAKVCPIKKQSLPRLELMAAHLLEKLVNNKKVTLSEELGDTPIAQFYWVDSVAILCWIRNDKVWKQFVRHRVSDILSYSNREEWFYCPGNSGCISQLFTPHCNENMFTLDHVYCRIFSSNQTEDFFFLESKSFIHEKTTPPPPPFLLFPFIPMYLM